MKIPLINGLRGIAIMGVLYTHIYGSIPTAAPWHLGWLPLGLTGTLVSNSYRGVQLFFVLSGFVLALPYMQGQRTMLTKKDILDFYRRRARRLLPLYYLCVLFGMAFIYPHEWIKGFLLMGTVTFNFYPPMFLPPYNTVLWTIGIEVWACLLLPFIFIAIQKMGMSRVLIGCVMLSIAVRASPLFSTWIASFQHGQVDMISNSVLGRLEDFVWGVAIAWASVRTKTWQGTQWMIIGLIVLYLDMNLRDIGSPTLNPFVNTIGNLALFLIIGSLLHHQTSWFARLLSLWPLQMIGLMSYSLYVWHLMLLHGMQQNMGTIAGTMDTVHVIRSLIVILLVGWLSYRYIEFGHIADMQQLLPQKIHGRSDAQIMSESLVQQRSINWSKRNTDHKPLTK